MPRKKISFFVHDLAANPIVRVAPLALAIRDDFDVEVLGFLFSAPEVYRPYKDLFSFKTVRCSLDFPSVISSIPKLASMATGDVIYACKPLLTSLGPAIAASRFIRRKPLFLDVEDDEWIPMGTGYKEFIWRDLIKGWRHATAWKYTRLLHPFTSHADGVSVVSRKLQLRYGGEIILHGPDERTFDPSSSYLSDPNVCRTDFNLPEKRNLTLFAGMPQPHKGLDTLVEALKRPECENWDLVLAGPVDHPDFQTAKEKLQERCHCLGMLPQSDMPKLLTAVHAVPVPQQRVTFTESQVPAKALEAMAMGKPVIGSRVGDLPEILGHGKRGWLIEPGDNHGLAIAFMNIAADPQEATTRGLAARKWFLREASANAINVKLNAMLHHLK